VSRAAKSALHSASKPLSLTPHSEGKFLFRVFVSRSAVY
jgi:hypothetical protein